MFGHAGLSLAASSGVSFSVEDGRGLARFDDHTLAVVTPVPRELGVLLSISPPAGQAFAVGAHGAL